MLAFLGRFLFFRALGNLISKAILYFHAKAVGRDEERIKQDEIIIKEVEDANRIRADVGRNPDLDSKLRDLDRRAP